jgi:hypothetical protein
MTPHYILEGGIRPWEESVPPSNGNFATISILVSSLVDLLPVINKMLPALGGQFAAWFRWHTVRRVVEANAIQRQKLDATLRADVGGFRRPVVRMDRQSISSVSNVVLPITEFELEALSDYRRELLIGTADSTMTSGSLLPLIGTDWDISEAHTLAALLSLRKDMVLGRCYDDPDTHSTFQWFGQVADFGPLQKTLADLSVRKLASRKEVCEALRE